jgi:hypothetical protein
MGLLNLYIPHRWTTRTPAAARTHRRPPLGPRLPARTRVRAGSRGKAGAGAGTAGAGTAEIADVADIATLQIADIKDATTDAAAEVFVDLGYTSGTHASDLVPLWCGAAGPSSPEATAAVASLRSSGLVLPGGAVQVEFSCGP